MKTTFTAAELRRQGIDPTTGFPKPPRQTKRDGERLQAKDVVASVIASSSTRIDLLVSEPPSANKYWRMVRNPKTGRNFMARSRDAKIYCEVLAAMLARNRLSPFTGDVIVAMEWTRAHAGKGDIENRWKVLGDALQGIAYGNDSQIRNLHLFRKTQSGSAFVRIRIEAANDTTTADLFGELPAF